MKDFQQKKSFCPSRKGVPTCSKPPEVTVVKHFYPNPVRENFTSFPKVRCHSNESPEMSCAHYQNPVFKYTDRFLRESASNNKRTASNVVGHTCNRAKKKVPEVKSCVASNFSVKKSQISNKSINKHTQDRILSNLSNIDSDSDLRLSLLTNHCPKSNHCFCAKDLSVAVPSLVIPEPVKSIQSYIPQNPLVDQLKDEIKKSKMTVPKITNNSESDEYVKKLREELTCKKDKSLDEARNIINELQSEILNYRLQVKTKYSSSCSDICERSVSGAKDSNHKQKDNASLQHEDFGSNHGDGREVIVMQCLTDPPEKKPSSTYDPKCETLWKSKGPFLSSSDLEPDEKPQEINFEEKLQEANTLIEKVRKALRDIGKGINQLPEQKKISERTIETKNDVKIICPLGDKYVAETKQEEAVIEKTETAVEDKIEDEITDEENVEAKSASVAYLAQLEIEKKFEDKRNQKAQAIEEKGEQDDVTSSYLDSLKRIQEKLQTISEMSDSDLSAEFEAKKKSELDVKKNTKMADLRTIDRACSPIVLSENTMIEIMKYGSSVYRSVPNSVANKALSCERIILLTQETQTSDNLLKKHSGQKLDECVNCCFTKDNVKIQETKSKSVECVCDVLTQETQTSDVLVCKKRSGSDELIVVASRDSNEKNFSVSSKKEIELREEEEEDEERKSDELKVIATKDSRIEKKNSDGSLKEASKSESDAKEEKCRRLEDECKNCQPCLEEKVSEKECVNERVAAKENISSIDKVPSRTSSKKEISLSKEKVHSELEARPTWQEELSKVSSQLEAKITRCSEEVKNQKSLEKLPKPSSSKKLSIQVMPLVSIRGGLTIQRTLNLFIKPTGSVMNDLTVKRNIGYEEVKVDTGSSEELQKCPQVNKNMDTGSTEEPQKCPQDCKNIDGGYSAAQVIKEVKNLKTEMENVEKDISGIKKNIHKVLPMNVPSVMSGASRDRNEDSIMKLNDSNLRENALFMFRSFQVVNSDVDSAIWNKHKEPSHKPSPATTEEVAVAEEAKESVDKVVVAEEAKKKTCTTCHKNDVKEKKKKVAKKKAEEISEVTKKTEEISYLSTATKSPWDIGFYKTKATQCSGSSLTKEKRKSNAESEKPSDDTLPRIASFKRTSSVSGVQSLVESNFTTEEVAIKDENKSSDDMPKMAVSPLTSMSPRSTTEATSPKSSIEGSISSPKKSIDDGSFSIRSSFDAPVKDESGDISMTEIMSILTENKEHVPKGMPREGSAPDSNLLPAAGTIEGKTLPKEKISQISSKSSKSVSTDSDTTDSSYSSENIHGSIDSPVGDTKNKGVKRPHQDEEAPPPTPPNDGKREPREAKEKKEKPSDSEAEKSDAGMQTSLAASSEETSSEGSEAGAERDRIATIKYFIKGLTGTSQEELAKLTSTHSVPKTDLPSYSRTVLRTLQEQRDSRVRINEPTIKESKEVEVGTTEYGDIDNASVKNVPAEGEEDDLSDNTKMERLRQFQKMASAMYTPNENTDDKTEQDKVIMSVMEQRKYFAEGLPFTKRGIPFYKRVLGRIVDSHGKKPMVKSVSDGNPIDESVSEGEIKCSASLGEIHPSRYLGNDRKKIGKGALKYLKKHHEEGVVAESNERTQRIARQRTLYNTWVTYYLQKHQNFQFSNESSTSKE